MALQARRYHGKPLLQPNYNFRDVPYCARDLTGSTLSIVTERQHLVDSIAEITLLCNEATRRRKPDPINSAPSSKKTTKPLSIEYIFDRIDTDDPLWGLMVRTDTPMSFKGRPSNLKASPHWKRGMLQGFITMTTFTNWQSSFRFDSVHEMAFGQDEDELEDQMKDGLRKYDEDGSLAEELEASVRGGNPHVEGIVHPRIAEVSLFGGLGCGKQLLRLLIEHLECLKATASQNYDFIVLQATDNSIPFYEAMGFTRVGCVQGKAPSPHEYHSSPVDIYHTKKNGETPASIAKEFGVDIWDVVFLNKAMYKDLVQKSWLKMGTKMFVPKMQGAANGVKNTKMAPKWYTAQENDTPRGIAKKFQLNFGELLEANRKRHPDLVGNSKLLEGTRIQISRFDIDEGDTIAYSHWTFPDADEDDNDPSYMMALKLNRKKGLDAKLKPVADSLAVSSQPYSLEATGVKDLLLKPKVPQASAPLAPIFTKTKPLKEPKKPKRPVTSYAYFTSDARSSMAEELKGMSIGEVNKILSEKWRALSEEEKVPYQERFEESKAGYHQDMKKYEAEMEQFRRESPQDTTNLGDVDTSLLEKVVKLKSTDGISGASKFEYYYVLTFIPDLQWAHLIPMRKVGVFGPEFPDACGRSVWMIVGEDEGKEFDTSAALCQPVTALTMKNSADADDEQWDIYDNGEKPPARRPVPFNPTATMNVSEVPRAPVRPKKPANSFALFCGDAHSLMKEQLENKPMSERTKIIAERWKAMTDEEKQKYKDQHSEAHEKYAKALKPYKEDLAKFLRENPGIDTSAISSKTPKSSKKVKLPAVAGDVGSQKKKRGRPRKYPLPNPDAAAETPSQKKRVSQKKNPSLNPEAPDGTPTPRKRGRPRKNPLPNPEAKDEIPTPKRKRGRPRMSPIDTANTNVVVHTVKKDPVELEKLLGKLKGDHSLPTQGNAASDQPGKNDIILSLTSSLYKEIMWRHFNILGETRDSQRENDNCNEVLRLLKQKMGIEGRFFKRLHEKDIVVDDVAARAKIIADIRRRVATSHTWSSGEESHEPPKRPKSPPASPITIGSSELGGNDVVLSLLNEQYKEIMWSHYRKLGKSQRGGAGEEEVGMKIFQSLKRGLGRGGRIFKKSPHGDILLEVNDDMALQKIIRDLKRRMESSHNWLVERPGLSPTRRKQQGCQLKSSSIMAEARPLLSPTRYPRRGSEPEFYPPEVIDKAQKPRQKKASPLRHENANIASSPAEVLPDAQIVEASGKGEAAAMQPTSPKDTPKPQKCPLAPIFLKQYGRTKKRQIASADEASTKKSRYPERKRKQSTDDSHLVSDDAVSGKAVRNEPRKKRARTNR